MNDTNRELLTWIMELCPEIQKWQAEIIAEHTQKLVESEREACAIVAETAPDGLQNSTFDGVAAAIRARGNR